VLIIGTDCLGAFPNAQLGRWAGEDMAAATTRFISKALNGGATEDNGVPLAPACQVCEFPMPQGADIAVALYGVDTAHQILVDAQTEAGDDMVSQLGFDACDMPPARAAAMATLVAERVVARDRMFAETHEATANLEKLTEYLAGCINCYNCRVACPVCYCKTCVFVTDVFDHEPLQYLRWAERKGALKMPTDTVFYHLTRLAHMSTACVGCGQCTNACPNDIPVMALFRTASHRIQEAFGYEAGRSLDEKPPLSVFRENEFEEIVGME
jgi:formate dehydrogenase subunit beta